MSASQQSASQPVLGFQIGDPDFEFEGLSFFHDKFGSAIFATSGNGAAIQASSTNGPGVRASAEGGSAAFQGDSPFGVGVKGETQSGTGVSGFAAAAGTGVSGTSLNGPGVRAHSGNKTGVEATSTNGAAVKATSVVDVGVEAAGPIAGVRANSGGTAVIATGAVFGVKATGRFAVLGTSNAVDGGGAIQGTAHGAGARGVWGIATGTRGEGVVGDAGTPEGLGGFFSGGRAPIRLFPGATKGAPTGAIAHQIGELYVDSSGVLFICTADGKPGMWTKVGSQ